MRRGRLANWWWCFWVVLACGSQEEGSEPKGATLSGTTACERYASLAQAKGCSAPSGCQVEPACESQTIAWVDCAASDLAQCLCESDGDLNCEGSFKPDEGPARCVAEMDAVDACESQ